MLADGATPGSAPGTTPPPGVQEMRRRVLTRLLQRFRHLKFLFAPLLFGTLGWVLCVDPAPWRMGLLAAGFVTVVLFGALRARPHMQRLCDRDFHVLDAIPFVTIHATIITATGGLVSPLLLMMFNAAHNSALLGTVPAARLVFALHIVSVWIMLALHLVGPVDPAMNMFLADGAQLPTLLIVSIGLAATIALSGAHLMGLRTREAVDDQLDQAVRARDTALGNFRERADELTTLSAEIAHELKNPLATVKGLAALIGKDAEGKAAERLSVLRREVDRMQGILDEFLNFSRPLAPLTVRKVDLGKLVGEVVELHEGLAGERKVELAVDIEGQTAAACDPRKIKQILVNLLQNAIDAAPPETRVEIVLRRVVDTIELQVVDHGGGVPDDLVERVFEAGMTTKPNGNGLGLPMARALARQHGGDLRLETPAPGIGCTAVLELPIAGPALAAPVATPARESVAREPERSVPEPVVHPLGATP
ncbi:MAG TPA: HAMP domain-containing sensor histidine kinase [Nannocystaceae bacterium]|nr:HAMP domain-containing sensor histidine kinase [Nannocystaceae bacterium]